MQPERPAKQLLDAEAIATRRLEHGLSERALARALRVSPPTIGRLEAGQGHGAVTLDRLFRLGATLGTQPHALLIETDEAPPPGRDDAAIEAALLASRRRLRTEELAEALGWTLARTSQALRHLARRTKTTGATLHRTAAGWQLRDRDGVLTKIQRQRLERLRVRRLGLTIRQLSLMRAILDNKIDAGWERRASNADRIDLAVLLRAGYARRRCGQITAADEVQRTLAALPEPTHPNKSEGDHPHEHRQPPATAAAANTRHTRRRRHK